jgi:hypothetical protein
MQNNLFRTPVSVEKAAELIPLGSPLLFTGSCFADNIGQRMVDARFPALVNPFGVLYNPVSVADALDSIMDLNYVSEEDLVERDGLWHSFMHHGRFSSPDASSTVRSINDAIIEAHDFLQDAEFLFITFGSAFVYEHKLLQKVVANCHKFPGGDFEPYMLEPDELVEIWKDLIVRLRVFNPGLKIIFTVSPVRHLKDGAHGNQLSKAVLLLGIDKLLALFEKLDYFPAYEIVVDELRDYRFYDKGMTHPDSVAVDYIMSRFCESRLSREAQNYYKEVSKITRAREHRASGHNTPAYRQFVSRTLADIHDLSIRYPAALLEQDRQWFQSILEHLDDDENAG